MADLKDLPIGTQIWYLQRWIVIIAHHQKGDDDFTDVPTLRAHYADEDGNIHILFFEQQSFDYLLSLIDDQKKLEAADAARDQLDPLEFQ